MYSGELTKEKLEEFLLDLTTKVAPDPMVLHIYGSGSEKVLEQFDKAMKAASKDFKLSGDYFVHKKISNGRK